MATVATAAEHLLKVAVGNGTRSYPSDRTPAARTGTARSARARAAVSASRDADQTAGAWSTTLTGRRSDADATRVVIANYAAASNCYEAHEHDPKLPLDEAAARQLLP